MSNQGGPSSGGAPLGDGRETITWSIHAATPEEEEERARDEARDRRDDEVGSGSSSSDASDEDRRPRLRRPRGRNDEASRIRERALADDHALRLAHAMTHNPADALLPSPPRSPPRAIPNPYEPFTRRAATTGSAREPVRIVTINDVKNRNCWICSDGDADEAAAADAARNAGVKPTSTHRRWLHPCKCTLVAHEDCLLTWIRTTRASDRNKPITCPQCAHPYNIVEYKPRLLRLFEAGNAFINDAVVYTSVGAGACTVYLTMTAYGIAAFRAFMGKEAASRAFGRGWPWHYYLELPCIPVLLVLSRIQPLDHVVVNWMAWIPIMMMFPTITQAPGSTPAFRGRSLGGRGGAAWTHHPPLHNFGVLSSRQPWPPGPIRLFFLLPWVRAVYAMVKRSITRRVLAPYARRRQQAASGEARARRNTRVIVVGEAAPAETLDTDGTVNVDENGLPRDLPPGVEAIENQETIYVSPQSLARLCCTTLSAPFVAKYMGRLLARLARRSDFLRRFLGLQRPLTFGLPASTSSSAPAPTRSSTRPSSYSTPLANLLSTGSFKTEADTNSSTPPVRRLYATDEAGAGNAWLEPAGSEYDDLDPTWFRNAIGLGLFVVVKDTIQLGYRYLRLEHARQAGKRTKIIDRPFVGGVVDQLELRD